MFIYIYVCILNIKTHINFSQIFRMFSKPSTVCVEKTLEGKFAYAVEIKN